MPGPFARVLAVAALLAAGVVAAVGGLALRPPGVVAVGVAGLLAGLTAAAIARDAPGHSVRRTVEAAAICTAATVGVLLVVAGTAALAGAAGVALLLAAAAGVWLARAWRRTRRAERTTASRGGIAPPTALADRGNGVPAAGRPGQPAPVTWLLPPVAGLSTAALGDEWVHTTAALAGRLTPSVRRAIVERREAALDELERRDPTGFARWMAGGPEPGSDPAQFVRGGPAADTEAA